MSDMRLMAGIEVDALKNGKLDMSENVIEDLDWVLATILYDRDPGKKRNTERLLADASRWAPTPTSPRISISCRRVQLNAGPG